MIRIPALSILGFVVAIAACGGGAPSMSPVPTAGEKLYIANQSNASITVVDQRKLAIDTVISLQALGFSAEAKPHHVAVEPDGSFWYVSLIGDGKVLKFDRANRLVGQVSMEKPGLLELDPRHDTLYAGRSMTAPNPPKSLAIIQRSDFKLIDEQEILLPRPHALVTTPDGKWTHTASLAENTIASLDVATDRVTLTRIPGQVRSLVQFAISPDGHWMVAGGELSNTVLLFDLTRPPPFTPVKEIDAGAKPWDPVFARDGRTVYFSLFGDNAVAEVDLAAGRVVRRITGDFAQPYDMIMRRDGKYLFVVNQNTGATPKAGESAHASMPGMPGMPATAAKNGWLSIVDLGSGKVVKQLMLGNGPTGMGAAGAR